MRRRIGIGPTASNICLDRRPAGTEIILLKIMTQFTWLHWALLSALFAGLTAVLAKAGVKDIASNLATAIRTVVILVFAWSIVLYRGFDTWNKATARTWL